MKHSPSLIATAAVVQALYIITGNGWNDSIEHYSGYSWSVVSPIIAEIQLLHQVSLTSSHQTVLEKYKGNKQTMTLLRLVHKLARFDLAWLDLTFACLGLTLTCLELTLTLN